MSTAEYFKKNGHIYVTENYLVCLIWRGSLAAMKQYSMGKHYSSKHSQYDSFQNQMGNTETESQNKAPIEHQILFFKLNILCGEFGVVRKTAKCLKSCPDGKCVKECLVTSVDIVCPCNSNDMHTKSFLAYIDQACLCTCCCLITDPQQRESFKIWAIFHCHGWKSVFIRYRLICCICVWASCRVQHDRNNAC